MSTLFYIASMVVLLLIFYQDLRYRGVSWYLFPLGLVLLLISTWSGREPGVFWLDMVLNTGFLAFQLALLTVYFAWKRVSFRQLWNEYMGIGDVLFFLILAIVLPFPFFPVFMIASLLLSTLLGIIVFRRSTVPLAGLQALFLLVFLLLEPFTGFSPYEFNLMY
ncbi:MAG TPA: hypothetical protein DCG19_00140 [Cryomorphaceae bacterium]|nr:hypothetical protein [Cryomorphaceae bacterium]